MRLFTHEASDSGVNNMNVANETTYPVGVRNAEVNRADSAIDPYDMDYTNEAVDTNEDSAFSVPRHLSATHHARFAVAKDSSEYRPRRGAADSWVRSSSGEMERLSTLLGLKPTRGLW